MLAKLFSSKAKLGLVLTESQRETQKYKLLQHGLLIGPPGQAPGQSTAVGAGAGAGAGVGAGVGGVQLNKNGGG